MGHTYSHLAVHCVFATKGRSRSIRPEIRDRLWSYMGGIARQNKMTALGVGGSADHVHLVLLLPPAVSAAKAVQLIKSGSSKWLREQGELYYDFEWQEGYGAFTLGISQVPETLKYVESQEDHHRRRTFREEFEAFLRKHGLPCAKAVEGDRGEV